ncbi:MAG: sensor histidine kinase [Nitriliruptoraceae bacterium]
MTSLHHLIEVPSGLHDAAVDTLDALVSDWQVLADLSFSDLLLFCQDGDTYTVVAQMRPYTAQTIYIEDLVGRSYGADERPAVARAFETAEIVRDADPDWSTGVPVREDAVPVLFDGDVIAVLTREANLSMVRSPSQLELTYLQAANDLSHMITEGAFPFANERRERDTAPRVGDGMMRLDATGVVTYASPNAISAFRRLGVTDNLVGRNLAEDDLHGDDIVASLVDGEPCEAEIDVGGTVVMRRLIPLTRAHRVLGGLLLVREVTELRRHERMLLYKDATIREIHHRVKNNLQTVASLLRLQSRRLREPQAVDALGESVRRISSIALVHETLSQDSRQNVAFDKVVDRLVAMLTSGLVAPEHQVDVDVVGRAGELPADVATPLALVLSELVQNALEHAFGEHGGTITVELERREGRLRASVVDDGVGVPDGWDPQPGARLGLQIATTLVESELGGTLDIRRAAPEGGTVCEIVLPIAAPPTGRGTERDDVARAPNED